MKKNENKTYDITDLAADKAIKILLIICRIKGVKCDQITFSFRDFERKFIRKWNDLMYKDFPYNYNSKMARSTDVSPSKIRDICNKK